VSLEAVPITAELEAYMVGLIGARDEVLARLEREADEKGVPIVGPQVGTLLYVLSATLSPRRMLELGTATGYSAIWLARGAPEARLVTVEKDGRRAEQARKSFREAGLEERVELVEGDALEYLGRTEAHFDLIFNDLLNSFPDEGTVERAFELSLRRLAPGGLLVADNALRRGEVLEPSSQGSRNVVRYNQLVARKGRLRGLVIPLRDGVSVARLEP
jgi:predicted O-methyltransferase YrrM